MVYSLNVFEGGFLKLFHLILIFWSSNYPPPQNENKNQSLMASALAWSHETQGFKLILACLRLKSILSLCVEHCEDVKWKMVLEDTNLRGYWVIFHSYWWSEFFNQFNTNTVFSRDFYFYHLLFLRCQRQIHSNRDNSIQSEMLNGAENLEKETRGC